MLSALLAAVAHACPAADRLPCQQPWFDAPYVQLGITGSLEAAQQVPGWNGSAANEPLQFSANEAGLARLEESLAVTDVVLDGAAVDPADVSWTLEYTAPLARVWVDVPLGASFTVRFDEHFDGTVQPNLWTVQRVEPIEHGPVAPLDATISGQPGACYGDTLVVSGATGGILVQPVGAPEGVTPRFFGPLGEESFIPTSRTAGTPALCEVLLNDTPDLLVWRVGPTGERSDPIVVPSHIFSDDRTSQPRPDPRRLGCATQREIGPLMSVFARRR